jgi:hypothetical protein
MGAGHSRKILKARVVMAGCPGVIWTARGISAVRDTLIGRRQKADNERVGFPF